MFYVYILHSKKDGKLYIGYTDNLKKRVEKHKNGLVKSTKHRLPIEPIYYEAYKEETDAKQREKYLKGGNGRKALKIQLKKTFDKIKYINR